MNRENIIQEIYMKMIRINILFESMGEESCLKFTDDEIEFIQNLE